MIWSHRVMVSSSFSSSVHVQLAYDLLAMVLTIATHIPMASENDSLDCFIWSRSERPPARPRNTNHRRSCVLCSSRFCFVFTQYRDAVEVKVMDIPVFIKWGMIYHRSSGWYEQAIGSWSYDQFINCCCRYLTQFLFPKILKMVEALFIIICDN